MNKTLKTLVRVAIFVYHVLIWPWKKFLEAFARFCLYLTFSCLLLVKLA